MYKNIYTVEELSHIMRLDYNTALKVIEASIPYTVVNNRYKITEDDFLEFMFSQTIYPKGHHNYID